MFGGFVYRLERIVATLAVGLAAATCVVGSGCHTPSAVSAEERKEISKRETRALYEAIVATYEARDLSIDLASKRFLLVRSNYRRIDDRLRRRFIARIVRMPGGASALRVRTEHQRRHGRGEDAVWKTVESQLLEKRARKAELELGRAIERRYREGGASASSD
jgi:ethanolamine ammonia-lyase small subunit